MKNILICTDGSNYSHEACLYGAWLSQQTQATISVLYVTDIRQFEIPAVADFSGSLGIQPFEGMVSQLHEVEEMKSNFVKEHALKTLKDAGVEESQITFHHETGLLVEVMSDYADVADLVLLGKRGENANFATEHLGSMLERVLRSVDQPCLVTNRKFEPLQKLAIAYDGGASCQKALDYIASNEPFRSMQVHLIVCVEGHKEDQASQRLQEAESTLQAAGLFPKCQVLSGEVETAIADYVEQANIDLLLLGAYGHSRIRELLIGSTTTELLRSCRVPVLCFR
ncbi:universal stress protein [Coraliomargarita sp. SDUM461003]|mgnify:FL=1|uniref:Universal stress protein n=1 Tax=Thalassobacterium maritimum TaxID=3041265 RepID=A0ABU1AQT5_9BACT|nr:universal stress protein [Coraliomargarita sp. SDUM461003]MBT64460.1 universal stress protein [Puniceicoccaceae bacterium]MDQ8206418.1 universal stress protein [Coraliomargarita sp. SDUM461003]HBR93270.1 universal stress protein [Opitutae bacterium]|tara:strand:+ start:359 stop:1207 length:849 start_codon:yes stop_codon:yes gene_type:complete